MWDTETHGKPAGRFGRSPLDSGADEETRRVLGPSNVAPDAAAHLEEAWRKMRAAAVSTRQHHRAEGAAVLDAFERVELGERAAVDLEDHRVALLRVEARRLCDPTLDATAVV